MKLAFTLHRINGDTMPGQVVNLAEDEFDGLLHFGAIREPNVEEVALYNMANPDKTPAKKTTRTTPSTATKSDYRNDLEKRAAAANLKFGANLGDAKLLAKVEKAEMSDTDALFDN